MYLHQTYPELKLLLLGPFTISCQKCQEIKGSDNCHNMENHLFDLKAYDVMMNVRGCLFPPQGSELS